MIVSKQNAKPISPQDPSETILQDKRGTSTLEASIPYSPNEHNMENCSDHLEQSNSEDIFVITLETNDMTISPQGPPEPILKDEWNEKVSSWYTLTVLSSIILGGFVTSCVAIIPQNNVIEMTEVWYEFILVGVVTTSMLAAVFIFNCAFWLKTDVVKNWTSFCLLSLVGVICFILV